MSTSRPASSKGPSTRKGTSRVSDLGNNSASRGAAKSPGLTPVSHPSPPPAISPAVAAVMRGNRKADTIAELRARSALHAAGLRFRKSLVIRTRNRRVVVDVAFPARRLAVFIDGCFWHSCPVHGTRPTSHVDYWSWKLTRNTERDHIVDGELRDLGWSVLRIWEHEAADQVVYRVKTELIDLLAMTDATTAEAPRG